VPHNTFLWIQCSPRFKEWIVDCGVYKCDNINGLISKDEDGWDQRNIGKKDLQRTIVLMGRDFKNLANGIISGCTELEKA
jgi:hypothetical protein